MPAPSPEHRTPQARRRARAWLLALALLLAGAAGQSAQAQLSITPTTWNVIGLDSNRTSDGPNVFPVGARVCNTGATTLNNVVATFIWDSSNIYINLAEGGTLTTRALAAGACVDYYFNVTVTRSNAAYNATRRFHITATADGLGTVSTPTPRELYVEKIVSQARNDIISISGPTTVYVGNTYQYTVNATTAPGGYEQLEAFLHLSNIIFQVTGVSTTYSTPAGGTNNKVYADACGWDNNPLSGSYRSCVGPANYPGGKAGDNISTTYTVKVLSTGTTTISSVVYDFSGSSYHYNGDFGQDTLSVTAVDPPITLSKSASAATVVNGGTVTYTLTVNNTTSQAITINDFVDTLPTSPASVSYVAGSSTFNNVAIGNPTISGSTLTWTGLFVVPAGTTRDLKFQATLPATPGTYTNSAVAHLEYNQIDTTSSIADNSPATAPVQVILPTDLTIAKTHSGNFTQGQSGTYTITVTNSGGVASSGTVTVSDTLPAGLTPGTATGTGWTCDTSGQTVTCTRADALSGGASFPAISLPVTVATNSALSLTNTATVSGGNDSNVNNNSSSDPTTINGVPDVTITKSHTGDFTQGQTGATYTLTVSNAGGAATSGVVTVTDTLPASLTSPAGSGTGWTCNTSGQTVTCTRSNALAAGASYPAITVTVNVTATAPSSVTNTGSVSGGGQTNTANDSASDPTTIIQVSDLTVTKTHAGNFTRGLTGSYTVTAANSGAAATAGAVTVTDTLPAGLTPTGAVGTGWTCNVVAQTVTCTRSDALASGASYPAITVTVSVEQNAASSVTNTAAVSGGGQVVTSNDTASDPTTIVSSSDLSLTKATTGSGSGVGTNASFTVTVTNAGPSDATNVAVRDQLPAGLTYVSSTPSAGAYNSGTGVWAVGTLQSGASATLQLVARVDALGNITNTAQVSASDQPDPDSAPNNDNASEDDQASSSLSTAPPNVTLCKTIQGQPCPPPAMPALPGSELAYVITFANTGGSSASSFVITDPIPANTDFKVGSVTSSPGTTGLTVTVAYSDNGGATWAYAPASGAGGAPAGYDRNVTHVRWSFGGSLSQNAPDNTGDVGFTVRIR